MHCSHLPLPKRKVSGAGKDHDPALGVASVSHKALRGEQLFAGGGRRKYEICKSTLHSAQLRLHRPQDKAVWRRAVRSASPVPPPPTSDSADCESPRPPSVQFWISAPAGCSHHVLSCSMAGVLCFAGPSHKHTLWSSCLFFRKGLTALAALAVCLEPHAGLGGED